MAEKVPFVLIEESGPYKKYRCANGNLNHVTFSVNDKPQRPLDDCPWCHNEWSEEKKKWIKKD